VRANAARALSTLEALPADAAGPLSALAGDPDDGVRLNAALALRAAPPGEASAALRRLLADPNPRVRLLAAGSLLASDPADPPATAPRLRRAALELVGSLGGSGAALLVELRRREAEEVDPALSDLLAGLIARLGEAGGES
jgi:HEAT repeat protein